MILAPLDDDDVVSSVADGVVDLVVVVAQMFRKDLIARTFRSVNSYKK